MEINVEWTVTPKSGLTDIELSDLGCKTKREWKNLSEEEQKKRLATALMEYDGDEVKFNPIDWDK